MYPYSATLRDMAGKRPKQLSKKERRKKNIRLIVQSNELVEARYMFDTWEMRVFHFFATLITKNDDEDKKYRIWLNDIKKAYKLNNNDSYHQLREATKRLSDKSVFLNYEKDGIDREVKHRFIKFVDYAIDGQEISASQEYVDVSIDKEMLPFLLHVQKNFDPAKTRYTAYDFRNVIELKPYSTRIYQLLKKEEYRKERILTIDEIKKQFNIIDEYKRFSTLYQRIIEPSLISINKHTDITIPLDKIEKLKRGRKIYAIRIPIYSKTKTEISYLRGEVKQASLFENDTLETIEVEEKSNVVDVLFAEFQEVVVENFGVTATVFLKVLNTGKYEKSDIEQAISVTRRAKYNQEIKKNIAGFFLRALKDGYTDPKEEAKKKVLRAKQAAEEEKQLQLKIDDLKQEKQRQINNKIREVIAAFPNITKMAIEEIRNSQMTKILIEQQEIALGRGLEIEDYRNDKVLRELVKGKIIGLKESFFEEIIEEFDSKIKDLEE